MRDKAMNAERPHLDDAALKANRRVTKDDKAMTDMKTASAEALRSAASAYANALLAIHTEWIIGGRTLVRGRFQQPSHNSIELYTRSGEVMGALEVARKFLPENEISDILQGAGRVLANVCPETVQVKP